MILAGDIGGTKTVLALYRDRAGRPEQVEEEIFQSQAFAQFDQILALFLEKHQAPVSLFCLGVAGPVHAGQYSKTTNLPWIIDGPELARQFGIPHVWLMNDLEAAAYGMLFLSESDKVVLQEGRPRKGTCAVIAAGTGLGEALLYWDDQGYLPVASEGGHVDFAPRNDSEIALFMFLRSKYGRVSYERVVSGPGIFNIYRFLRDTGFAEEPEELRHALAEGDPSVTITTFGLSQKYKLCVETLDLFASLYGAEAGNLALKGFATGGVYIGGGIAPKIVEKLKDGALIRAFTDKGRYTDLMKEIPVIVSLNSRASLIGVAHYAILKFGKTLLDNNL